MKQFFFAAMLLMSTELFAQSSGKKESVPGKHLISTGYGVLSTQYSRFNGQSALFVGAYGGWMINHKLMIGLGGYGLASRHQGIGKNAGTNEQNQWKMGYGGLMVEYHFYENKRVYFTVNTLIGGGIIKNGNRRGRIPENGSDELKDIDASGFYVIQPSVNLEMVVTNWFHIGAGVGYRFVTGTDQPGITNAKMSAKTANLSFKFGVF
jgi:hypothetical protein